MSNGDFNGDGTVDLDDFGTLKANFGTHHTRAVSDVFTCWPSCAILAAKAIAAQE